MFEQMNKNVFLFITVFILNNGPVSAMAELPDPTRPADYLAAQDVIEVYELPKEFIDWNVTAIRIKKDDRSAIINDQLVRVGEQVGPAKVIEIKPVSVLLDYEGKHVVVRLFSDIVEKKISKNTNTGNN